MTTPPAPTAPLPLPGELEPYRYLLAPYAKPAVGFTADGGVVGVGDSHVGGHPYLPHGAPWPMDALGVPMTFLLQLNFDHVPRLPGFPWTGLLQWFVGTDALMGQNLDNLRDRRGFEVRFLPGPSGPSVGDPYAQPPTPHDVHSPLDTRRPVPLAFTPRLDLPDWESADTTHLERAPWWYEIEQRTGMSRTDVWDVLNPQGGRVGGYPSFVQFDPRPRQAPWPQLVQLDSDAALEVTWADSGVGHLFGNPNRMAVGDLSDVAYHWDTT